MPELPELTGMAPHVQGFHFPQRNVRPRIPLLYYSYHVIVGLERSHRRDGLAYVLLWRWKALQLPRDFVTRDGLRAAS